MRGGKQGGAGRHRPFLQREPQHHQPSIAHGLFDRRLVNLRQHCRRTVYEDLHALWARAGDKAGGRRSSASLWRATRVPAVEFLTRRSSTCRTPMIEFVWPALSAAFYQTMHCRPPIPDVMLSFSRAWGDYGLGRSWLSLPTTEHQQRSALTIGAAPPAGSFSFSRSTAS